MEEYIMLYDNKIDNILLWGTGRYADKLFKLVHYFKKFFLYDEKIFPLKYIVDSAVQKKGTVYNGYIIFSPEQIDWEKFSGVVFLAVKKYHDIVQFLKQHGISEKRIYISRDYQQYFFQYGEKIYRRGLHNGLFFTSEQRAFLQGMSFLYDTAKNNKTYFFADCQHVGLVAGLFDYFSNNQQKINFYKNKMNIKRLAVHQYGKKNHIVGIYYRRLFNGGAERVISRQLSVLCSLGIRVVLFLDIRNLKAEYPIPRDVSIVTLGDRYQNKIGWYYNFGKAIEQYDIDIVYCHDYLIEMSMLPWLVHVFGKKLYTQLHCIFTTKLTDSFGLFQMLYRQSDRIAVLSRVDQLFWRIEGVNSRYLPNPINYSPYISVKRENGYLLWCARVEQEQKQVFDVIPIMKHVKKRLPEAVLHIVGTPDSPEILERLKEKIHEENLEENIIFEGYAANPEQYYQKAQICLMTSRFEGFPMVLVEAMAQGVPVVMYDLPYLEIVRQCQGIERVPMNDTEHMADRVVYLLQHPEQLEKREVLERDSLQKFMENNDYQEKLLEFLSCPDDEQEQEVCLQSEDLKILVETLVDAAVKPLWSWK